MHSYISFTPLRRFRAISIVVLAILRLQRHREEETKSFLGQCTKIGEQVVCLSKQSCIHQDTLPMIAEVASAEGHVAATALMRVVEHLDPRLLEGVSHQTWKQFRSSSGGNVPTSDQIEEDGMAVIRRGTLQMAKQLRILQHERSDMHHGCNVLQQRVVKADEVLNNISSQCRKAHERVAFLEKRVQELQQEAVALVPLDKYDALRQQLAIAVADQGRAKEQNVVLEAALKEEREEHNQCRRQLGETNKACEESCIQLEQAEKAKSNISVELSQVQQYTTRKMDDLKKLEQEVRKQSSSLREAQAKIHSFSMERQSLQSHTMALETEVEEGRQLVAQLESSILQAESQRQLQDECNIVLSTELSICQQQLHSSQEMITALNKAHHMATQHASDTEQQLKNCQQHIRALEKELENLVSREETEQIEREELAKAKRELLSMRCAAEKDLNRVIGAGSLRAPALHQSAKEAYLNTKCISVEK